MTLLTPPQPPGADIIRTQPDRPAATAPAGPVPERTREAVLGDLLDSLRRRVLSTGGYHHRNYRQRLSPQDAAALGLPPGSSVLLRTRRPGSPELVQRTWPQESAVLRQLAGAGERLDGGWGVQVPRVLHQDASGAAVLLYVEGRTLDRSCPPGSPVPTAYLGQIGGFFAELARLGRSDLPPLPDDWPADGDSTGFLRARVRWAAARLSDAHWDAYGGLFSALGVPPDAMERFGERTSALTPRPFGLLHTDVHRRNIVVGPGEVLSFIDWEHAMFGDPLYDLATHLCRTRYPLSQQRQLVAAWGTAVTRVSAAHARGLARDLPGYLAYERAQSVYPDVIRAADSLGVAPDPATLQQAVLRVEAALSAAAVPLGLAQIPSRDVIGKLLAGRRIRVAGGGRAAVRV